MNSVLSPAFIQMGQLHNAPTAHCRNCVKQYSPFLHHQGGLAQTGRPPILQALVPSRVKMQYTGRGMGNWVWHAAVHLTSNLNLNLRYLRWGAPIGYLTLTSNT